MVRAAGADRELPFSGRASELDHVVSRVLHGAPASCVVAGTAGVGKSRLVAEVADVAARSGHPVATVAATKAASTIPFGAFAPLLPVLDGPVSGRAALLTRAREAVVELGRDDRPLVLVVDDAHLLDDASATLVHQLVIAGACSVVATVRAPGVAPDPVTALWKDGLADRVDLDPLGRDVVATLARGLLGGPLTGAALQWLWDTSTGNPLFVRELLHAALRDGALRDAGGVWVLDRRIGAPARLGELVAARLAGLPDETATVVDLLALGEPLDLSVLETLTSAHAVEQAETHGLVVVDDGRVHATARLGHPLYGDLRRSSLPRSRRRSLSRRLADAVSAMESADPDDALRIATWRLDAGEQVDPVVLERAARRARVLFDLDQAARLGRAALDAGGGVSAGLVVAEADFFSGRHREAEELLSSLEPRCDDDDERALVANARAYTVGALLGDHAAATAVVDAALATITSPGARRRVEARRAVMAVYTGALRPAYADAAELLDAPDDATAGLATYVASLSLAVMGRGDEAERLVSRSDRGDRPHGAPRPEARLVGATLADLARGRLAAAAERAAEGYRLCRDGRDDEGTGTFGLLGAWVALERGAIAEAGLLFRESAAVHRALDDPAPLRWCLGGEALAAAMAGDAPAAGSALAELAALPQHWMSLFDPVLVDRARAWGHVVEGRPGLALPVLGEAAARAADRDQWVLEAMVLHDVARLGDAARVRDRLRELADVADGDLLRCYADHVEALAAGAAAALESAAERFADLGATLLAAEAAAAASSAYERDGLTRRASALARSSAELRARCGLSGLPVPTVPSGTSAPLTAREREVALLAASGMRSREIAERLVVSVRTVENHLQRAYEKLGVAGREQLAEALRPS